MCPSHADEVSLRFSFRFFFLLVVVVEKKLRRGPSVKTRPAKRSARSFCVVVAVVVVVVVVVAKEKDGGRLTSTLSSSCEQFSGGAICGLKATVTPSYPPWLSEIVDVDADVDVDDSSSSSSGSSDAAAGTDDSDVHTVDITAAMLSSTKSEISFGVFFFVSLLCWTDRPIRAHVTGNSFFCFLPCKKKMFTVESRATVCPCESEREREREKERERERERTRTPDVDGCRTDTETSRPGRRWFPFLSFFFFGPCAPAARTVAPPVAERGNSKPPNYRTTVEHSLVVSSSVVCVSYIYLSMYLSIYLSIYLSLYLKIRYDVTSHYRMEHRVLADGLVVLLSAVCVSGSICAIDRSIYRSIYLRRPRSNE